MKRKTDKRTIWADADQKEARINSLEPNFKWTKKVIIKMTIRVFVTFFVVEIATKNIY